MSEQENMKIARTFWDNFNAHDVSRNLALQSNDYVFEGTGAPAPLNSEQAVMFGQSFLTAFPDLHFDITLTIAQGDYVVTHWRATGTHTGPLATPNGSIPPTGRTGNLTGSYTFEIKNGKMTRGWSFWDMTVLLAQLGLLPG